MLADMRKLARNKRVQVLSLLVEGVSLRSITRLTGVSINTVTKLLVDAGKTCAAYHDRTVRDMETRRVQCDEIWSFCYAKDKNVATAKAAPRQAGDVWTWTALDSDSKMILAYEVGDRSSATALEFMDNLRARLANRVQITTDGHKAYLEAVEGAFGGDVDFAPAREALRQTNGEKEPRAQVFSVRVHRSQEESCHRFPRKGSHQHVLRGAPQPDHADGYPSVHPPDQRFQQENREPCVPPGFVLCLLQLHPCTQNARHDASDGGRVG